MRVVSGSTLGIPDTVMGLTFVAAGVSVPDALSSLAVVKEGESPLTFVVLKSLIISTSTVKPEHPSQNFEKGLKLIPKYQSPSDTRFQK